MHLCMMLQKLAGPGTPLAPLSDPPDNFYFFYFWQQYFVCDYSVNVDCVAAEEFYALNDNFGVKAEEGEDNQELLSLEEEEDLFRRR